MIGFLKRLIGGGDPKPVAITPFAEKLPVAVSQPACDGVTIEHVRTFAELRAILKEQQAAHPLCRAFMGFDDVGQADYTSGHVAFGMALDEVEGRDLSRYDPARFDPEDPRADCPELFPERLANFMDYIGRESGGIPEGVLSWSDPDVLNDVLSANRDPDAVCRIARERDFFIQFAPVDRPAQVLASFPNGYFHGDLTPAQNYALAERFHREFGLELDGIGSSFLSFGRDAPLDGETAQAAAIAILALYSEAPAGAAEELAAMMTGRDWVLVRYTQ
jgi:hypothetical protein